MKRICLFVLLVVGTFALRGQGVKCDCAYPIVFVHGWAGSEESWLEFSKQLKPIWGDEIVIPEYVNGAYTAGTVYYANLNAKYSDGQNQQTSLFGDNGVRDVGSYVDDDVILHHQFSNAPELLPNRCVYAISFQAERTILGDPLALITAKHPQFENDPNPFPNESASNQSAPMKQGYALGQMIKTIQQLTGKEKVILVAHSMGGLTSREYLQRKVLSDQSLAFGLNLNGGDHPWWPQPSDPSGHGVAKLFTVGTPHRGSPTGDFQNLLGIAEDALGVSLSPMGLDIASEAVRDMRPYYSIDGLTNQNLIPGSFLYSSSEQEFYNHQNNQYFFFRNYDVSVGDSDGDGVDFNDQVVGINNNTNPNPDGLAWKGSEANPLMGLPDDIKYTYYVSDGMAQAENLILSKIRGYILDEDNRPDDPVVDEYLEDLEQTLDESIDLELPSDGIVFARDQWLYSGGDGSTESFESGNSVPYPVLVMAGQNHPYFSADRITTENYTLHLDNAALCLLYKALDWQNSLFPLIRNFVAGAGFGLQTETTDFEYLFRGLDEGDYPYFAHTITPERWYAGMYNVRADIVPDGSNSELNDDNTTDTDWYKVELSSADVANGNLVFFRAESVPGAISLVEGDVDPYSNDITQSDVLFTHILADTDDFAVAHRGYFQSIPLSDVAPGVYYIRISHLGGSREEDGLGREVYRFGILHSDDRLAVFNTGVNNASFGTHRIGDAPEDEFSLLLDPKRRLLLSGALSDDKLPALQLYSSNSSVWAPSSSNERVTLNAYKMAQNSYDFLHDDLDLTLDKSLYLITDSDIRNNFRFGLFGLGGHFTHGVASPAGQYIHLERDQPQIQDERHASVQDVISHEYFHQYLFASGKLTSDNNETRALQEGFADIFGILAESQAEQIDIDWLMGEDVFTNGSYMRSLANPPMSGESEFYGDNVFGTGYYQASTVLGKFFYLLCEGGSKVLVNQDRVYRVEPVGIEGATSLLFSVLQNDVTSSTRFVELRNFLLAESDLSFGPCSLEANSVKNALYAVGLLGEPAIMVLSVNGEPAECELPNGSATIRMVDDAANYTYQWPGGATGPTVDGLAAGDYVVTITKNAGGCSLEYPFTIERSASFTSRLETQPLTNCNEFDGSATVQVQDRETEMTPGNMEFTWLNAEGNIIGSGVNSLSGLDIGNYSVEVVDADRGCGEVIPFEIVAELPEAKILNAGLTVICTDDEEPEFLTLSVSTVGCVNCTVLEWTSVDGAILQENAGKTVVEVPVREATYRVLIEDENGCQFTDEAPIVLRRQECLSCDELALDYIDFTGVDPCREFTIVAQRPVDPNEIHGPTGQEALRWMAAKDEHSYTVLFENDPVFAEASASKIEIDVPMDAEMDLRTFTVGDFNFANQNFEVPAGNSFYQDRLDLRDSLGVFVDVLAGVDITERKAFWVFEAIDLATGLPPDDPDLGILPVNDTITRAGEGAVHFSVLPIREARTRDTLSAQAAIIFDDNETILTNTEVNTLDAVAPTTVMDTLPEVLDTTVFTLTWSGSDDTLGSGIKSYEVYLSEFGGPFYLHRSGLVDTFLRFEGYVGGDFCFLVKGLDLVGNQEVKTEGETCVRISAGFRLDLTVLLEGPLRSADTLMSDNLRANGYLPRTEPYTNWGYLTTGVGLALGAVDSLLLAKEGSDAVVDWVFLQLRSSLDSSDVVAARPALLRRDGKVTALDGRSAVDFGNVAADSVHLLVFHRNHLPVATMDKFPTGRTETSVDLTDGALALVGGVAATKQVLGLRCLVSGDANGDGTVNAVDRNVYWRVQNGQPYIYPQVNADFNMDGQVNAIDQNIYWRENNSRSTLVEY